MKEQKINSEQMASDVRQQAYSQCNVVGSAVRVQRKRLKGWRMPENTVYVGRGSRWGNPFRLVKYSDGKWAIKIDSNDDVQANILVTQCHAFYETKEAAAKDAIKCYSSWLLPYTHEGTLDDFFVSQTVLEDALHNLQGKNLACWCKLDEPCHADYLLSLVAGIR